MYYFTVELEIGDICCIKHFYLTPRNFNPDTWNRSLICPDIFSICGYNSKKQLFCL